MLVTTLNRKSPLRIKLHSGFITGLILLVLAAIAIQLYSTVWGAGVSPDSTRYLEAAQSLIAKGQLRHIGANAEWIPLTLWAPLYPVFLSTGELLDLGAWSFGRYLNSFFLAANLGLIAFMIRQVHPGKAWLALAGAALTILSTDVLRVHAWIWTEPAAIFFGFAGLMAFSSFLVGSRRSILVLSGLLFSAAVLIRYAALSFFAAALIMYLGSMRPRFSKAWLTDLGLLILTGLVPMILWSLRNRLVSSSALGRDLIFNLAGIGLTTEEIVETASTWLIPGRIGEPIRLWLSAAGILLWLAFILYIWRSRRTKENHSQKNYLVVSLLTYVLLYPLMLFAVNVVFTPGIHVDGRVLTLPYIAGLMLTLMVAPEVFRTDRYRGPAKFLAVLVMAGPVLLILMNAVHTIDWVRDANRRGLGYASRSWHESRVIGYLQEDRTDAYIISNVPEAIYFWTGRRSAMMPGTNAEIRSLAEQARDFGDQDEAWIVFFRGGMRRFSTPNERALRLTLPLDPIYGWDEGSIYALDLPPIEAD